MFTEVAYADGVYKLHSNGVVEFPVPPLDSIVKALARECRFGGHTFKFYSVAEHSVNCAGRVWEISKDPIQALQALWHECAEGLGFRDINGPLKHGYGKRLSKAENYVIKTVFTDYLRLPYPYSELVKGVDLEYAAVEGVTLVPRAAAAFKQIDPGWRVRFECWDFGTAEQRFWEKHWELSELRVDNPK